MREEKDLYGKHSNLGLPIWSAAKSLVEGNCNGNSFSCQGPLKRLYVDILEEERKTRKHGF
jgi:hypothetical protein